MRRMAAHQAYLIFYFEDYSWILLKLHSKWMFMWWQNWWGNIILFCVVFKYKEKQNLDIFGFLLIRSCCLGRCWLTSCSALPWEAPFYRKLAKKRGWFVSFVPASFWFDKRTARQISLTGGPLPTDYLCEQGTWPAWTRVFLRGRGPGDERAWERSAVCRDCLHFRRNRIFQNGRD